MEKIPNGLDVKFEVKASGGWFFKRYAILADGDPWLWDIPSEEDAIALMKCIRGAYRLGFKVARHTAP